MQVYIGTDWREKQHTVVFMNERGSFLGPNGHPFFRPKFDQVWTRPRPSFGTMVLSSIRPGSPKIHRVRIHARLV